MLSGNNVYAHHADFWFDDIFCCYKNGIIFKLIPYSYFIISMKNITYFCTTELAKKIASKSVPKRLIQISKIWFHEKPIQNKFFIHNVKCTRQWFHEIFDKNLELLSKNSHHFIIKSNLSYFWWWSSSRLWPF